MGSTKDVSRPPSSSSSSGGRVNVDSLLRLSQDRELVEREQDDSRRGQQLDRLAVGVGCNWRAAGCGQLTFPECILLLFHAGS